MNKENLKKKVYDHIMEAIIQGEYSPDDILSESMLTEKYNVSKSPVREALVQLCSENVLKSIPRCGYMVVRITRSDIEDILDYRAAFEAGMLRQVSLSRISQVSTDMCSSKAARVDLATGTSGMP